MMTRAHFSGITPIIVTLCLCFIRLYKTILKGDLLEHVVAYKLKDYCQCALTLVYLFSSCCHGLLAKIAEVESKRKENCEIYIKYTYGYKNR